MPTKATVEPTVEQSAPVTLSDLMGAMAAMSAVQQVPAAPPTPTPEQIAAALGLTVAELDTVRDVAIQKSRAATPIPDEPLDTPVRFWCDRYRGMRFLVNGKRRKFINGQFLAQTQNEYDAVKKLANAEFIFEGDDVTKPIRCRVCDATFRNSEVFQDHMSRHVLV